VELICIEWVSVEAMNAPCANELRSKGKMIDTKTRCGRSDPGTLIHIQSVRCALQVRAPKYVSETQKLAEAQHLTVTQSLLKLFRTHNGQLVGHKFGAGHKSVSASV